MCKKLEKTTSLGVLSMLKNKAIIRQLVVAETPTSNFPMQKLVCPLPTVGALQSTTTLAHR